MSYANVTSSTAKDDNIVDLLKKPFYVQPSGEQNIIVKQRLMPNLQETTKDRSFQQSWYAKKICSVVVFRRRQCFAGHVFCFVLENQHHGQWLAWIIWRVFHPTEKSTKRQNRTWAPTKHGGPTEQGLVLTPCTPHVRWTLKRSTAALKADFHWMQIVARWTFCSHFP